MKTFFKIAASVAVAFISSCASIGYQRADISQLKLGLSKIGVHSMFGKPSGIISARHDPADSSTVEVEEYYLRVSALNTEHLLMYFKNDKLDKWHVVRPDIHRMHWDDRRRDSSSVR